MKNENVGDKKIDTFWGNRLKIYGVVLFVVITSYSVFGENLGSQVVAVKTVLSLSVIILPILAVESIFASKRFIKLLLLLTGMIMLMGNIFFKLWPLGEDKRGIIYTPLLSLTIAFLVIYFKLIKDSKKSKMEYLKIDGVRDLVGFCFSVKSFGVLLVLELWTLLLGAFSHILVVLYGNDELSGIAVLFLYLVCSVVFFFANLIAMFFITRKIEKSTSSVILFAIITPIVIPLCITYFVIFLLISEILTGGVVGVSW
ncbi:MAG: hypothetical protein PHX30_04110 [Candidatus Pacebacteria bacterium]|jgi:hypothetical protein|nr:hypothetical protein [Candidatus Paceibacterota bacterium]